MPVWLVAILVGRELVLGVALLVLRRYGYPPLQVHYLGKAATLLLLYAFPGLLLAYGSNPVAAVAEPIAWALTIWGTALYVLRARSTSCRWPASCARNGPPRAGRRRDRSAARRWSAYSLGASLLDAVLAETLDPAYAEAAAAAPPGRRRIRRGAGARPRWRGAALVALTMASPGCSLAVTYNQANATAQGREQIRARLIADIEQETAVSDGLTGQLQELRVEVGRTQEHLLEASEVGQGALDELLSAEQGAAAVPVTGPGLLVTLANADPKADADPVGGATEADPRGRVQDGYLQMVVNALWAAGAEGVSINGRRLGPTTAIRFAGEAVLVDFRPVTSPYEVSAVGEPGALQRDFLAEPGGEGAGRHLQDLGPPLRLRAAGRDRSAGGEHPRAPVRATRG